MIARPYVIVSGPTSANLVPFWGSDLLSVSITDQAGYESDEAVLTFKAPPFSPPPKGTRYSIKAGFLPGPAADFGSFTVSRTAFGGSAEDGETMEVHCRAADFIDKMKASGSKHYDPENGFGTAGKIFESLAAEAGVSALVSPAIASIEIPYRLRLNQSLLDFATELADEIGAVVKPQAGKLVVLERGKAQSGSGKDLQPILIDRRRVYGWDVDIEERPAHEKTETSWYDPQKGRVGRENQSFGEKGGPFSALHLTPSQAEAKKTAATMATALTRWSGTGSFEMRGNPAAVAGAPVTLTGFGAAIGAVQWVAGSVSHTIDPEGGGWVTTVEVETRDA
ncbi:hypothetical protein [Labrenzia sp. 011]|uniref:phage late control D family protein n=1 Tax=Labrenzia sp. 011 TaxID=2171494 RepID=UPI00197C9176|nr:hypothetical protein [Labrenzia sp. 011]